jgi:TusA-related sulfurtransferase
MQIPAPSANDVPAVMVVDAGGEPWEQVEPLLARRVGELPPAAVLELFATEPGVCAALPHWCAERGHALERGEPDGDASVFRIRRGDLSPMELR